MTDIDRLVATGKQIQRADTLDMIRDYKNETINIRKVYSGLEVSDMFEELYSILRGQEI